MEDSVGWFVASKAFLGKMLMALSQALDLSKPKNKVILKLNFLANIKLMLCHLEFRAMAGWAASWVRLR